jgi:hypothetical protein
VCQLCESAFTNSNRRHHCRHCGLLVCASCSPHKLPIPKFDVPKPTRVCIECAPVLELHGRRPLGPPDADTTDEAAAVVATHLDQLIDAKREPDAMYTPPSTPPATPPVTPPATPPAPQSAPHATSSVPTPSPGTAPASANPFDEPADGGRDAAASSANNPFGEAPVAVPVQRRPSANPFDSVSLAALADVADAAADDAPNPFDSVSLSAPPGGAGAPAAYNPFDDDGGGHAAADALVDAVARSHGARRGSI